MRETGLSSSPRLCAVRLPVCFRFGGRAATTSCTFPSPAIRKRSTRCQVIEDHSDTVRYLTAGVLVRVNRATDTLEPELAESWKLSDDSRSITFHLRAGLKFSDNSPLDANDVARTLNTRARSEASLAGRRHISVRVPAIQR